MENESSIKEMIRDSLEQIRTVIDADTIVGKQIVTPGGTVIIPISKVSMGFATGGLDLPSKNDGRSKGFGGGGGTGVSVSPIGFLTVSPEGDVKMIPMTPEADSPIEQVARIVSQIPDLVARIKDAVGMGGSSADDLSAEEKAYEEKIAEDLANEVNAAALDEELADDETDEDALTWRERRRIKKERKKLAKEVKRNEKEGKVSEETLGSGTL